MKPSDDILSGLPAEQYIREGIDDLKKGKQSISSCLVRIASPRLLKAGIFESSADLKGQEAELNLYALLKPHGNRAYPLYNSLLRELVSFEQALDHRLRET